MKKYYLHDGKQQIGPFYIEDLKQYNINSETMIWSPGMEKWAKASTFSELADQIKDNPPPFEKTHFGSEAFNKAKDFLNKDYVDEIEQKIPNTRGKRSFKIAIFVFAIIGLLLTTLIVWVSFSSETEAPENYLIFEKAKYNYEYDGSLNKIEYVEGYVYNISESTQYENIKVQFEFFSDDNQLTCWALESQVLKVIPHHQRVYIKVLLPIQKESRTNDCNNVRGKVIGAEIHQ